LIGAIVVIAVFVVGNKGGILNPFGWHTFFWYWYEWALPIVVAPLAFVSALVIFRTSSTRYYGVTIRVLAVFCVFLTLPLFLMRIGIDFAGEEMSLAATNVLGAIGSAVTTVFHFTIGRDLP